MLSQIPNQDPSSRLENASQITTSNINIVEAPKDETGFARTLVLIHEYPNHFVKGFCEPVIQAEFDLPSTKVFIAQCSGRDIGTIMFNPRTNEMNWLAISQEYKGKFGDVAIKLFLACFRECQGDEDVWFGVNTEDAYIPADNPYGMPANMEFGKLFERARRLYKYGLGLDFSKRLDNHYGPGQHVYKISISKTDREEILHHGRISALIEALLNVSLEEITRRDYPVFIGISLGNPFFRDPANLKAYIQWGLMYTKGQLAIIIPDTLHAINWSVLHGLEDSQALLKSQQQKKEVKQLIHGLTLRYFGQEADRLVFVDFGDTIQKDPQYQQVYQILYDCFYGESVDQKFRERVSNIVRNNFAAKNLEEHQLEELAQYIIGELPLLICGFGLEDHHFCLLPYPGLADLDQLVLDIQQGAILPQLQTIINPELHNKIVDLQPTPLTRSMIKANESKKLDTIDAIKSELCQTHINELILQRPTQYVPGYYEQEFNTDWLKPNTHFKLAYERDIVVGCLMFDSVDSEFRWEVVAKKRESNRSQIMKALIDSFILDIEDSSIISQLKQLRIHVSTEDAKIIDTLSNEVLFDGKKLQKDKRIYQSFGFRAKLKIRDFYGPDQHAVELIRTLA
jgi:tRNA-dependent cyclodipeptide synthase